MAERRGQGEARSGGAVQQLLNVPFGKMVESFAAALQEPQEALDRNSLATLEAMADRGRGLRIGSRRRSMLELGLVPAFYHFPEARFEARVSFTIRRSSSSSAGAVVGQAAGAAPVDSSLASKYSFPPPADSSSIKTRLVSKPVPATLSVRLRQLTKSSR
jgi:hypothetical protein